MTDSISPSPKLKQSSRSRRVLSENWLFFVLFGYIFLFIVYQAAEPFINYYFWGIGQQYQTFEVENNIHLSVESPKTVVRNSDDSRGQPLTIWAWSDDPVLAPPGTVITVSLITDSGQLIFRDWDGVETAPAVSVALGDRSSTAARQTLFVQKRNIVSMYDEIAMGVRVQMQSYSRMLSLQVLPPNLIVQIEAVWVALVKNLLNVLFSTIWGALVAVIISISKFFMDHQDRLRKEEEKRKEDLKNATDELNARMAGLRKLPIEETGKAYIETFKWTNSILPDDARLKLFARLEEITRQYSFGRPWLINLRESLATDIEQLDDAAKRIDILEKSRVGFREDELKALRNFITCRNENPDNAEKVEQCLGFALQTFGIVGIHGKDAVLQWFRNAILPHLKQTADTNEEQEQDGKKQWVERVCKQWFREGGAAGQYLLRALAEEEATDVEELNTLLEEWEEKYNLPRALCARGRLWPDIPAGISIGGWSVWSNPFGPLRAEEDPRLSTLPRKDENPNSLFWTGHEIWKENLLRDDSHRWFRGKSGSGISALIWITRDDLTPWNALTPGFTVYLPLKGQPSVEKFQQILETQLAYSLLHSLFQDPFWLITADEESQLMVSSFLYRWADDDLDVFLTRLKVWGFTDETISDQFLLNTLLRHITRKTKLPSVSAYTLFPYLRADMTAASRSFDDRPFSMLSLVELTQPATNPEITEGWVEILMSQEDLWQSTVVKVFETISGCEKKNRQSERSKNRLRDASKEMTWSVADIIAMLKHRRKQCRVDGAEISDDLLTRIAHSAKGLPRKAIEIGNACLNGDDNEECKKR